MVAIVLRRYFGCVTGPADDFRRVDARATAITPTPGCHSIVTVDPYGRSVEPGTRPRQMLLLSDDAPGTRYQSGLARLIVAVRRPENSTPDEVSRYDVQGGE